MAGAVTFLFTAAPPMPPPPPPGAWRSPLVSNCISSCVSVAWCLINSYLIVMVPDLSLCQQDGSFYRFENPHFVADSWKRWVIQMSSTLSFKAERHRGWCKSSLRIMWCLGTGSEASMTSVTVTCMWCCVAGTATVLDVCDDSVKHGLMDWGMVWYSDTGCESNCELSLTVRGLDDPFLCVAECHALISKLFFCN
jgi:hypothetical protein